LSNLTITKLKLNFHISQLVIVEVINYLLIIGVLTNFATKQSLMNIGENIKKVRKDKGLQQKQVALEIGLDQSNYNKIENSKREPSVDVLNKLANLFGVSVDDILNPDKDVPKEVTVEDKTTMEQVRLIQELDEEDKHVIFRMIDTMLTKKKFKDFFNKNIAAL
jgi:transcriptional regulator with XRE-family HTH domain